MVRAVSIKWKRGSGQKLELTVSGDDAVVSAAQAVYRKRDSGAQLVVLLLAESTLFPSSGLMATERLQSVLLVRVVHRSDLQTGAAAAAERV